MRILQALTPNNLLAEKEHFFSDDTYNPQFKYDVPPDLVKTNIYQKPTKELLDLATVIVEKAYSQQSEEELRNLEGQVIPEKEVERKVELFIAAHDLTNVINHVWSVSFLSRATMSLHTLKLRSGVEYRDLDTIGMIYHELGTHALRRLNYEQQPWYKKKKKYGFSDYLASEEGLAITHSLLPKKLQLAYSAAIRYLACAYSQQHSFVELWNYLKKYISNSDRLWTICVRQKRGIEDTSQSGGYTKDFVYFEGFVEVINWLRNNDYRLEDAYYGKMALTDVEKAKEMNPHFKPLLPLFYTKKRDQYIERIEHIYQINFVI